MKTASMRWVHTMVLPDGHRLFRDRTDDTRFAVGDESGDWPEDTDDGVLYLNFGDTIKFERNEESGEHISLPLIDPDRVPSRTPTNMATAMMLSRMFNWTIEDVDRQHYYTAGEVAEKVYNPL